MSINAAHIFDAWQFWKEKWVTAVDLRSPPHSLASCNLWGNDYLIVRANLASFFPPSFSTHNSSSRSVVTILLMDYFHHFFPLYLVVISFIYNFDYFISLLFPLWLETRSEIKAKQCFPLILLFWNWSPMALLPDFSTGKCEPLLLGVVQGPAALASPQNILEMENPRFGESDDFLVKHSSYLLLVHSLCFFLFDRQPQVNVYHPPLKDPLRYSVEIMINMSFS